MGRTKKGFNKNSNKPCKTNNHKKQINWEFVGSIIAAGAAVISIIISIIIVSQMIKDRNAAYRPSILINPVNYSFSWNENGSIDWIDSLITNNSIENDMEVNSDGSISGTISIPVSFIGDGVEQFTAVNVGVGSAKQVVFQWHESNIEKLYKYLIQCDATKEGFVNFDKSVVFDYNGKIVGMGLPADMSLMYMLPEATEIYEIPLPTSYYLLIQEIIKAGGRSEDIPYLLLSVTYDDIQGNEYTDIFLICTKIQLLTQTATDSGNATFQLVPLFSK